MIKQNTLELIRQTPLVKLDRLYGIQPDSTTLG